MAASQDRRLARVAAQKRVVEFQRAQDGREALEQTARAYRERQRQRAAADAEVMA